MNVLYVNNVDLRGRRFNGYDLLTDLQGYGIASKQAVLTKMSDNDAVFSLLGGRVDEDVQAALRTVEARRSMDGLLFPWGRVLKDRPEFLDADVVHYHLVHNGVVSLLDLPMLFSRKPSVWTLHDPWMLTGHCLHPMECGGWLTGCRECPHLDWAFPMKADHADRMWRIKSSVLAEIDVDIIVASEFMRDLVRSSPLTRHLERVHLVPFGIDQTSFLPDSERTASRARFGIPEEHFVILFRSTDLPVKGTSLLVEALMSRPPERPTTIVTVDQRGLAAALSPQYNVIELGWVNDPALYSRVYSAADVFVMPSRAESFGLMALEAMAAGRPVICFEQTAVASVTHAPECGIAVPYENTRALRDAIDGLSRDPDEAARRGMTGREIARKDHGHEEYLGALAALYRAISVRAN